MIPKSNLGSLMRTEGVRQEEDQRTSLPNIILLIASAGLGFLTQYALTRSTLPLAVLLIALGVFGGIASERLHARSWLQVELAWGWWRDLYELHLAIQLDTLKGEAKEIHRKRFPRLLGLRLHLV
jgi:hypothetical protein